MIFDYQCFLKCISKHFDWCINIIVNNWVAENSDIRKKLDSILRSVTFEERSFFISLFFYFLDPYCNPKCPQNAFCKDKKFRFICQCDQGYEEYKGVCIDVNECRNDNHNCDKHAECHNQEGSFTCTCDLGYKGFFFFASTLPQPFLY